MQPLKAVFFGERRRGWLAPLHRRRRRRRRRCQQVADCRSALPPVSSSTSDLDDTLVLTEDCDRAAFKRVAALAEELVPGVCGRRLVNDWRPMFHSSPWCPEGKVGCTGVGGRRPL